MSALTVLTGFAKAVKTVLIELLPDNLSSVPYLYQKAQWLLEYWRRGSTTPHPRTPVPLRLLRSPVAHIDTEGPRIAAVPWVVRVIVVAGVGYLVYYLDEAARIRRLSLPVGLRSLLPPAAAAAAAAAAPMLASNLSLHFVTTPAEMAQIATLEVMGMSAAFIGRNGTFLLWPPAQVYPGMRPWGFILVTWLPLTIPLYE